ncbi:MAG: hypothetical protein WCJ30_26900 [Deltaproteobacteria bacterium]
MKYGLCVMARVVLIAPPMRSTTLLAFAALAATLATGCHRYARYPGRYYGQPAVTYQQQQPVYYQQPAQVYQQPQQVYVQQPAPVYVQQPQPVYVQQPVVQGGVRVYVSP